MIIQQEARADLSRPWPIAIEQDGTIIAGRPDAVRVIGFQEGEVQHIVLMMEDVKDPNDIVGLVPVFVAKDGSGMFAVLPPVQSVGA